MNLIDNSLLDNRLGRLSKNSTYGREQAGFLHHAEKQFKNDQIQSIELVVLYLVFHACQEIDCTIGVPTYPAVMKLLNGQRVDVIPPKTTFTLHNYQISLLQNVQMLHNSTAIQQPKLFA